MRIAVKLYLKTGDSMSDKPLNKIEIALAGNPNVGKSTIFNSLTGLNQHTGNWPGKTVAVAEGFCESEKYSYRIVDLPGTYSILPHSPEEEIAREYLCSEKSEAVIVVCDGTCLERNLIFALQIINRCENVLLCVNLLDEAKKKKIYIDIEKLSSLLGVPVVGTVGRSKKCRKALLCELDKLIDRKKEPQSVEKHIDDIETIVKKAEEIYRATVSVKAKKYNSRDRGLDRIFTSKWIGFPIMLLLVATVFWITLKGANYPSAFLSKTFIYLENKLAELFDFLKIPNTITDALVHGVFKVSSWVVSVMLPPMAIFFPFFTLLEDSGYLPRIAFNLDRPFKCAGACGKQALTMCMGFGCNAAGVVGCRIIDSQRERLLAIVTNSLVPCNGRFPTLISIITMFVIAGSGTRSSFIGAMLLTVIVSFGIVMTLLATKLLSATVLKGKPSSFALELPPYRRPQIGKVIFRSIFDRTLFVLARSLAFAAPAGFIIWLLANTEICGTSSLLYISGLLDPIGKIIGLDGAILLAFVLGLPANEIVIPIITMIYLSNGYLNDISDISTLKEILISNGWTIQTAISMIVFSMFHWPCATTLATIKKETGSLYYVILSIILPTAIGALLCFALNILVF